MWLDKNKGWGLGNSVILEDFTQDALRTDLTVTEWCQRSTSSDRIHFLAPHGPVAASVLLAIHVQKGKFLAVLLSAYLKD